MSGHLELRLIQSIVHEGNKDLLNRPCDARGHVDALILEHGVKSLAYAAADQIGDTQSLDDNDAFSKREILENKVGSLYFAALVDADQKRLCT
jgi:hypothetical protein